MQKIECYFEALRTSRAFILNGHYVISKTTISTKFEGIRIDYIVDDSKEIIKSTGNFSQSIRVQVNFLLKITIKYVFKMKSCIQNQFLAGSINSKVNNGVIKYVYFVQKLSYDLHTNREYSIDKWRPATHEKDIPLNSKIKLSNQLTHARYLPQTKWVYQEGGRSESTPCNKMCNGVQRIRVSPSCMYNQNLVDETLCSMLKKEPKYIEKPCNIDCKLQQIKTFFKHILQFKSNVLILKFVFIAWKMCPKKW